MIKHKIKNTFHDKIMDCVWQNLQNTTWLFRLIIKSIAKNFLFLYITFAPLLQLNEVWAHFKFVKGKHSLRVIKASNAWQFQVLVTSSGLTSKNLFNTILSICSYYKFPNLCCRFEAWFQTWHVLIL
jgi:hypothetical protein